MVCLQIRSMAEAGGDSATKTDLNELVQKAVAEALAAQSEKRNEWSHPLSDHEDYFTWYDANEDYGYYDELNVYHPYDNGDVANEVEIGEEAPPAEKRQREEERPQAETPSHAETQPHEKRQKREETEPKTETQPKSADSYLRQFSETEEKVSEPLCETLREAVENMVKNGVTAAQMETFADKYQRPSNCPTLAPVKINEGIWSVMSTKARTVDSKLQKQQVTMIKAMTAVASAANDVRGALDGSKQPTEATFEKLVDGLAMIAALNKDLNMKRRFMIKPEINPNFRHLCAPSVPITTRLFGDNVQERIKQQGEANKAFHQILSPRGRGRGRGFRGGQYGQYRPTMNHTASSVGQDGWMGGRGTSAGSRGSYRGRGGFMRGRGSFSRGRGYRQNRGRSSQTQ